MPCKGNVCQDTWKQVLLYTTMLVVPSVFLFVITLVDDKLFLRSTQNSRCPEGTFPCGNLTSCVPQQAMCNSVWDCENGADEDHETCSDDRFGMVETVKVLVRNDSWNAYTHLIRKPTNTCELLYYPKECDCVRQTRINCSGKLETFPSPISPNVTFLDLSDTGLASIPNSISNLTQLETLNAGNNELTSISAYVFSGLNVIIRLYLMKNKLEILRNGSFHGLYNLQWLMLWGNRISIIEQGVFSDLSSLQVLLLSDNLLTLEPPYKLRLPTNADSLLNVELQNNQITSLSEGTIKYGDSLQTLHLQNNKITEVDDRFFSEMEDLLDLNISYNFIKEFRKKMFPENNSIRKLAMAYNPVKLLDEDTFETFRDLVSLDLKGISLTTASPAMFANSPALQYIYFKKFEYCRFAPMVRLCEPKGDGISSINNLLDLPVHRICIWVVAFLTCTGNIFVMVYRVVLRDERNIHSLFIKNLCAADFMMGLYLLIVASHDVMFRDEYNRHSHFWMSSWCCQATGFLAMLSCEVSIILVTFMSIERGIRIALPYKVYNFNTQRASISLLCIWALGLLIAAIPVTSTEIFGTFYGSNGVCFPLHIHEPFLAGWEYSCFVFVGINFIAMIVIAVCYIIMFLSIRKSRMKTSAPINMDVSFAKRFFLIVFTDALCWIPIIAIKLLAFANITISDQFYAWLTIFVLPINSAINPIMYSLTTTTFRRKFEDKVLSKWRSLTSRTSVTECSVNTHPIKDTAEADPGNGDIGQDEMCLGHDPHTKSLTFKDSTTSKTLTSKEMKCDEEETTPLTPHNGNYYTHDNKICPLVVTFNIKSQDDCDRSSV